MKSQFQALLLDAVIAKRSGALTGTASSGTADGRSTDQSNMSFSLIIRNGEIVGGDFAERNGMAAVLQLLDAPIIDKVRWFQMRDSSIAASEPLLPSRQLQFLIYGSAPAAPTGAAADFAKPAQLDLVKHQAVEVFQRLFGDSAEDRFNRIVAGLGHSATAADVAQACIAAIAPLLGEAMARSYFQQFL